MANFINSTFFKVGLTVMTGVVFSTRWLGKKKYIHEDTDMTEFPGTEKTSVSVEEAEDALVNMDKAEEFAEVQTSTDGITEEELRERVVREVFNFTVAPISHRPSLQDTTIPGMTNGQTNLTSTTDDDEYRRREINYLGYFTSW
ncbi:uncharacterized protein LOC106664582 [Cimex lectularius]|uniref:Uncharacterized protein n=1 Tax=Cimex lectularius TaxID=79782 RepID=A0A8I6RL41_CIMLE|nr:uncharacterized protein LOC106664582 [Cimex lectularius]